MNSLEEKNLVDNTTGATQRFVQQIMAGSNSVSLENLKGKEFTEETNQLNGTLPKGMLGGMESSKLILGGNLLRVWREVEDVAAAGQ